MKTNIRPLPELLQVFLDNQDLFETTLYKWLIDLNKASKITKDESIYVYSVIGGIKIRYSDILNSTIIKPRIDWLKEKLK